MNATTIPTPVMGFPTVMTEVWTFLLAIRTELFLFCAAVVAYFSLFANVHPKKSKTAQGKQAVRQLDLQADFDISGRSRQVELLSSEEIERAFQSAYESDDYRQVLRCWTAMKRLSSPPSVCLAHVVESMQRFRKDSPFILRELQSFLRRFPNKCCVGTLNDLVESLGRRLDSELVTQIIDMMLDMNVKPDQRTYELLLGMHFTTRNFSEVKRVVADMKAGNISLTPRALVVLIKTSLKTDNFDEAIFYFRHLKAAWLRNEGEASPSVAPRHIVSQLVDLSCKDHRLRDFVPLLEGVPITDEVVSTMLSECIRQKDTGLTHQVEQLARRQDLALSDMSYSLLIKGLSGEPARVLQLFNEVVARGTCLTADFATALLAFCSLTGNVSLANQLFDHMKPTQLPVLSSFIRFYAENEQYEKACDVYEHHSQCLKANDTNGLQSFFLDARLERSLMNAALRCNRHELAKKFLEVSPTNMAKHVAMIQSCAASNNLQGAKSVFQTLKDSGLELNSVVYNTVLHACVECQDIKAAEEWMLETKEAGFSDVVSYNTLIKAYLQNENFAKARALMEEMRKEGLQPNRVTFNELINGMVTSNSRSHGHEIWATIKEMQMLGVNPNQVTCSILLKNLSSSSTQTDITETMELINGMEDPMDEVLLSSVVEACVRIGKPDLLASKLRQFQGSDSVAVTGSHTFGSLIKAYGHARDIDGVWRCWKEMRSRHIRPTSITLGCMVEAVVSNGDTEGAYELIHQMQEDEHCNEVLNSVIYCSVLKGFTREKKLQRVWAVYEEMLQRRIDLSVVTYNTLIDACARCGRMDRVPEIVDDMKRQGVKANLITYSTMLKGHCQMGDIQRGFAILEEMQKDPAKPKPDEIMYNSLLDGCAQNNLVEEGLGLVEKMQKEGIQPSNYTLSLLVKLMSRARKLDNAFTLVEDLTRTFNFRPNVHVYTNLIQACVSNRQLPKAMATLEQMVRERVQPDNRTCTVLVRASLQQGLAEQAVQLLRSALGLHGGLQQLARAQQYAVCPTLVPALVEETLAQLCEKGKMQELGEPLLSDIKQNKPHFRVNFSMQNGRVADGQSRDGYHAGYGGGNYRNTPSGGHGGARGRGGGADRARFGRRT